MAIVKQLAAFALVATVSYALFLGAKRLPFVGPYLAKIG